MSNETAAPCLRMEILGKVITCVDDVLDNPKYKVEADSNLVEDLAFDSLDIVELTMELEEDFEVDIPEWEATKFTTPNAIADTIMRLKRC